MGSQAARAGAGDAPRAGAHQAAVPRWLDRAAAVGWRLLVVGAVVFAALVLLAQLQVVLVSAVVAVLAACALSPGVRRMQRQGVPATVAALVMMAVPVATLTAVGWLVAPQARAEIEAIDVGRSDLVDGARSLLTQGPLGLSEVEADRLVERVEARVRAAGPRLLLGAWDGALVAMEIAAGILLSVVLTFFFLRDGGRMWSWVRDLLPADRRLRWDRAARSVRDVLAAFIRGTAIVSAIDGVGIGLGLYLLGVPLAVPLAVLTFVAGFVPIVGATLAGLVAVLVALASEGPVTALAVLGVVVAVQQLEGNILQPAIVGRSVRLHPAVILLAVGTGAVLWGVIGALLAVPVTAAGATVLGELRRETGPVPSPDGAAVSRRTP